MPTPPATAAITKPTRRISGSTPSRGPSPAQTPPSSAPSRRRRSGAGCASGAAIDADVLTRPRRARAGQPAGEQDAPDRAEHRREHVVQADVEHVGLVEQQDQAEEDHDHPADERGGVEAGAGAHGVPAQATAGS